MGDADKALADLTEFLRLNPKYAAAYGDRALAHFAKGNHAKAIADLAEAIRIDPKMAEARWGRAVGFLERADDVKAQEDWVQAKMLTFARKGSGGGP
jgi:Flp pilus assembly protein TadD